MTETHSVPFKKYAECARWGKWFTIFQFLDAYIFRRGYTKTPDTPLTQNIPPPTATHPKSCPPTQNIPRPHLDPPPPTPKNCPPTQNIPPPTHLHNHPSSPTHPKYTSIPQSTNKKCPPNPTQFQILIALPWFEGVGEGDDRILKVTKPWRDSFKFT